MDTWKIIWKFIKPFLPWIIIALLCIYIFFISKGYVKQYRIARTWENNYSTIKFPSKQVSITKEDLEEYFKKYTDIANKINIRSKEIEHIINTDYFYHIDTIDPNKLIFKDVTSKQIEIECFKLTLKDTHKVTETIANIKAIELKDDLTTFLYWKRRHKINLGLFELNYGKKDYFAKTYSECKQDTISVQNNIKILKRVE